MRNFVIVIMTMISTALQAQDTLCIEVSRGIEIADSLDLAKAQGALIDTMQAQLYNYEQSNENYKAQLGEKDKQIDLYKSDSTIQAQRITDYQSLANANLQAATHNYNDAVKFKKRAKSWRSVFWVTLGTGIVTGSIIYLTR